MTHPLAGHHSADESARVIRNYRYATERMMRMLGGWIALTPELSAKLLMGRHVLDNAQHADAFGKRLPELRSQAHVSEPANPAFADFMDAIEAAEAPHQTVERLVGMYRVLKPHMLAAYREHLERANPVYEPPTRRILTQCADDEQRHIDAGETVIRHLITTPELQERAVLRQEKLEELLAVARGVTGSGLPALTRVPPRRVPESSDDAETFIHLERTAEGWVIPEDLRAALDQFGDALAAGDRAGTRRWLLPGSDLDDVLEAALSQALLTTRHTVAFARVGQHRLVKCRFDGPEGSVMLAARWVLVEGSWRAAALEVARLDLSQPA